MSPYHFGFNNPIKYNDPDGENPILGAIIGAAVDYGTQVAGNLIQGKSLTESLTDVDGGSILKSAALGAVTSGASAFIGTTKTVVTIGVKANQVSKVEKAVVSVANTVKKTIEKSTESSRAARRQVMRDEKIPTSQQPKSQSKNDSGREYTYETKGSGGKTETKSVQQQTKDRSHQAQPHWEAGKVKTDNGKIRMNNYGRPKLENDKSKVNY